MNDNTPATAPPSNLAVRSKQALKVLHVVAAAVMLGGLVAVLALIALKTEFAADEDLFLLDLAALRLFEGPVTWGFAGLLATGIAYALYTDAGIVRWRWITLKWLATLGLAVAAALWIVPAVNGMAALGDAALADDAHEYLRLTLLSALYLAAAVALLAAVIALSVFRPFGPHRRQIALASSRWRIAATLAALGGGAALYAGSVYLDGIRQMEIADNDPSMLGDGSYHGEAACAGQTYRVEVAIESGEIRDVRILERRDSVYARYAERLLPHIVEQQSADVDAITGATTTSKCLLKAVERALGSPSGPMT